MSEYTSITIIYNSNSTGSGEALAKELKATLRKSMPKQAVKLLATKYAGHAEELAYELACASAKPLVISASGDGGYHEVINGLLRAQKEGAKPIAGLLPAGNANDHFHDVHNDDIAQAISEGQVQRIDLLKLSAAAKVEPFERYAHSYIGFGLTPKAGKGLNKTKLNWFNQIWIVLRVLFFLRPIQLRVDGKKSTYDSLICSNVSTMSKVLSLSAEAENSDGKFEITIFRRQNKLKLIATLLKASTAGLTGALQTNKYSFETLRATLVQLDGEIFSVEASSKVTISIEHKVLRCIV